jgi:hypothetical protein
VATLRLLSGRVNEWLSGVFTVEKCGIVVSGMIVAVVAALLFLLTISWPGMAMLVVRIDAASEARRW